MKPKYLAESIEKYGEEKFQDGLRTGVVTGRKEGYIKGKGDGYKIGTGEFSGFEWCVGFFMGVALMMLIWWLNS